MAIVHVHELSPTLWHACAPARPMCASLARNTTWGPGKGCVYAHVHARRHKTHLVDVALAINHRGELIGVQLLFLGLEVTDGTCRPWVDAKVQGQGG